MKRKLLHVNLLILLAACSPPDYRDLGGNQGDFADLQGKWVLINYWAVWCKPCREEIPELNAVASQLADSVVVFGVNFDAVSIDQMGTQAKAMGIEFAVLQDDPASLLGYARPEVLPTTYVFDPQGKLVRSLLGPQTLKSIISLLEDGR
jgi:thiol-disulfide isomerase/thioredoxin|tara:strand:- start:6152 stop:6598 length:447 start_codon:yes stop_codon:yes gene_type:complete